jgi:hypothetical protein
MITWRDPQHDRVPLTGQDALSEGRDWVCRVRSATGEEKRVAPGLKEQLHDKLREVRAALLSKLDRLSEYDLRRPVTPTGTNLLGLVKHLAGLEYGYLGDALGRSAGETLPWIEDDSIWAGADMWAAPGESSEYITGLYARACAHADEVITSLDLDAPATVAHWPAARRDTTLGFLLIRMTAETAQHAGHADIVRELIDGTGAPDHDEIGDSALWQNYAAQIQAAADHFTPHPADLASD